MSTSENSGTLAWRVSDLERRVNAVKPEALADSVSQLKDEIKTVKRLLWTLITIALTASVTLSITLVSTFGHP